MKVAFDEHVPTAMVTVLIDLANQKAFQRRSKGIILEKAEDYAPKKTDRDYKRKSDVPWLDRFAASGGRAIISGDVKMQRERNHEMLALHQHGFVVISFERQWAQWNFFRKTALIVYWWEEISNKIRTGDRGTFWVVPCQWPLPGQGELRNVSLGLAKLLRDSPNKAKKPKANYRGGAGTLKKQKDPANQFSLFGTSDCVDVVPEKCSEREENFSEMSREPAGSGSA